MADVPRGLRAREEYAPGDLMRVMAMFFVVLIHVSGSIVIEEQRVLSGGWWVASVVNASCCWGVPVFIMLSGALLLPSPREEPVSSFYRRRFARVGIPAVAWSVIYAVGFNLFGEERFTVAQTLQKTLTGSVFLGQYFLFLIAGLYLVTPFLRTFIRHASRRDLGWAVLVAIGLSTGSDALDWWRNVKPWNIVSVFVPYLGYFLAGAYLRPWQPTQRQAAAAAALFATAVAAIALLRGWTVIAYGAPSVKDFHWAWYTSPAGVAASLSAFAMLAWWQRPRWTWLARLVRFIAPHTLGIFVIHSGLITLIIKLFPENLVWKTHAWPIAVWTPVIFFAALGMTLVMRRIPLVRYLVG